MEVKAKEQLQEFLLDYRYGPRLPNVYHKESTPSRTAFACSHNIKQNFQLFCDFFVHFCLFVQDMVETQEVKLKL